MNYTVQEPETSGLENDTIVLLGSWKLRKLDLSFMLSNISNDSDHVLMNVTAIGFEHGELISESALLYMNNQ